MSGVWTDEGTETDQKYKSFTNDSRIEDISFFVFRSYQLNLKIRLYGGPLVIGLVLSCKVVRTPEGYGEGEGTHCPYDCSGST